MKNDTRTRFEMRYGAIMLLVAFFLGCASGENGESDIETVSFEDLETYEGLAAALENSDDIALYDVRTAEEYADGHIPGAINIPYDVIGEQIPIADKEAIIVVYCRSGNRSNRAKMTLQDLGYTNVADFGAVSNWLGDFKTGDEP